MLKCYKYLILIILLNSCTKEVITNDCNDGSCTTDMFVDGILDENGYYHIDYPSLRDYFNVYIVTDDVDKSHLGGFDDYSLGHRVVTSQFTSPTYYSVDNIPMRIQYFSPFESLVSSTNIQTIIKDSVVSIPYNKLIPVVESFSYLQPIDPTLPHYISNSTTYVPIEEHTTDKDSKLHYRLWGQSTVSTLPTMRKDTITIFSKVNYSEHFDHQEILSIKVVLD